ncbi:hypothetical protein ES708_27896 [subsurface metagenome]
MRSEQVIKELAEELEKLTGFIGEHGMPKEHMSKDFDFACTVCDALAWVLGEISTKHFTGDAYLNLFRLKHIARAIEIKTGKKLTNHE